MPTFREEVEGAYELIEGALSQRTVDGVALRYVDRLPKIAVALGQPLSGPGRAANRQALLRILKRALSKFHEDKRAIAKARGEEIRRVSGDPVRMESIFSFQAGGAGGRQPPALFLSKCALQ